MNRVVLLMEDRVGHLKQVEAVAELLARERGLDHHRVRCVPRSWIRSRLRKFIYRVPIFSPQLKLRILYGTRLLSGLDEQPKAFIGSGTRALLAGLLLSKIVRRPYIHCGHPDGYPIKDIDRLIVYSPRAVGAPNAIHLPFPVSERVRSIAAPGSSSRHWHARDAAVTVLIGGDGSGYRYTSKDWTTLAATLSGAARDLGMRCTVITSRRTPRAAERVFATRFRDNAQISVLSYRQIGPVDVADHLQGDAIVVTIDSLSMIAEAAAAKRPVVLLVPRRHKLHRDDEVAATLIATSGARPIGLHDLDAEKLDAAIASCQPNRTLSWQGWVDALAPLLV